MDKSKEQKKQEFMEHIRQLMELVERMSPEEKAAYKAEAEAFGKAFLPDGHQWHTEDEEE